LFLAQHSKIMKSIINNQRGFGLIEALVAIVISGIAMTGLFVGSGYARAKAVENYHYRVALLRASEVMENIKHYNRYNKGEPRFGSYMTSFVLDERKEEKLMAYVDVTKAVNTDFSISVNTRYSVITVTVNWEEAYKLKPNSQNGIERTLAIREDYYYNVTN
jgi:prepilin-type N-terminal cleavage/methylation domain-containing protein